MDEKIIIREVRQEDDFLLAKLIREAFEEHDAPRVGTVYSDPTTNNLHHLFQFPGSVLWVAETNDTILGCCGVYPTEGLEADCAELVKFYLSQKARGKGIGKKLMEQCMQSAIELGYKKLYLESLPQFSKAVGMYEKLGFQKLEHAMGNSGHTACNIWMTKQLH